MFELKISEPQLPEAISWNYEELKAALTTALAEYESIVYTEDSIAAAKRDKATLNNLKKAINDERIRREKEYMQPFNTFKDQAKEICSMIDSTSGKIGEQIDVFETKRQEEKKAEIERIFSENWTDGDWLKLRDIFDDKWLNKTTSLSKVEKEMNERLAKITSDLVTIQTLPSFSFEATEIYKRTLDLNTAIAEGQRLADIQRRKAEAEAQQALQKAQEPVQELPDVDDDGVVIDAPQTYTEPMSSIYQLFTVRFEITESKEKIQALASFCKANDIHLKKI